jgi:tRNA-2-methylthio-N6-dimethylallyladenosine synthase
MIAAPQKKVYIRTFGCQMNEHDTEKMYALLEGQGYLRTEAPAEADLLLYNTCTIREKASQKAHSELGRARSFKKARPGMIIGVCGCVAQQEGENLRRRYPDIDLLFGPDQIARLPELIAAAQSGCGASALALSDDPASHRFVEAIPAAGATPASAFVAAMKGCDCACSYCIVPSVRGREISRPADEIVREVRSLAARGTKEVVLLGQNVAAYGKRSASPAAIDLAGLVRRIADETDIVRIRFTSPNPRDIGDALVAEYARNEKLCPHLHLPVQSGSDATLRRMRRGYGRERVLDIARKLREARPDVSITTDLIVGFCGETEHDFEETLSLVREVAFDSAFAFKYSPRPGTDAATRFADDVPAAEKERRLTALLALLREIGRDRNEALVGTRRDALVEGHDRMGRGLLEGRLPDNRIVHFAGHPNLVGTIVPVVITQAKEHSLSGERAA